MDGGAIDKVVGREVDMKEVGKEGGQEAREELEASSKHITEAEDSVLRSGWKEESWTLLISIDGPNPSLEKGLIQISILTGSWSYLDRSKLQREV